MGKNINPKSLKGKDKTNRIKDLMGRMNTLNESTSLSELDLIKKAPNGVIYGVVRENHKYFIKTTEKKTGKLMAEDFDYIGGLQNKFSEAYNSYAEVTKQLNLKFDMLNESFGIEDNVNILESDGVAFDGGTGFGFVVEDEEVEKEEIVEEDEIEEQEYKLKVDAPAPTEEPSMELPVEDEVDMGVEDEVEDPMTDMGDEDPMGEEGEDVDDTTKKIQKMTGKIGQMFREMDDVDTDLEKYVINSVISALHLDQFSDEDIEDVISKLEGEDDEDDMAADDIATDDMDMEDPMATEELPLEEPSIAEESFKIKKSDLVEGLTKKLLKTNLNESWEDDFKYTGKRANLKKLSKKRGSLKGKQHRIDKNRNGRIDSQDFKMLRGEHHDIDMANPKSYGKYDRDEYMMREDSDMEMSSTYVDCPRCEGMGCPHCGGEGFHLSNEMDSEFDMFDDMSIADDFMTIDGETGEYGPFDRDGDGIASSVDQDDDGDGFLDEMEGDGYGMDVMDSVSGSISDDFMTIDGETGEYGPFDRDGDEIASSVDMDADGDGQIDNQMRDNDFGDLDIEFFSDPMTKPRTRPGIGDPTTTPGKKERKGPWTKPKTTPKPKASDESPSKERRSFRRKGWYK